MMYEIYVFSDKLVNYCKLIQDIQFLCNFKFNVNWAAAWENQQSGMCTNQRLISTWALAQSYQSLRCGLKG